MSTKQLLTEVSARMSNWVPNLFGYLDFREFLGDYYTAAKANIPNFSYRYFAGLAGFASPNFLKLVIDGKRNLGPSSVDAIAQALRFDGETHRYFAMLVEMNQGTDPEERSDLLGKLVANRRFKKARQIDGAFFEYLSNWFYPAIRELAARADFSDDPEWLAEHLLPSVPKKQITEALEALFRLGLLVREEDGSISRGDPTLTTAHEITRTGTGNFHRQMLERASESIRLVKQRKRDLSAMTVCVSPETLTELKRRLQRFREEIMDLCDSDEAPTTVYQINMQVFPLSQDPDEEP